MIVGREVVTTNRTINKDTLTNTVTIILNTVTSTTINGETSETVNQPEIISFTKNGEFNIDHNRVSSEDLKTTVFTSSLDTHPPTTDVEPHPSLMATTSLSSGGLSWLTYYKETSKGYYTLKAYKEPTNYALDGGKGTPRMNTNVKYGSKVVDFKNLARRVSDARANIVAAGATLVVAGFSAVYWWTIIALLGAAGTAGIAAYQIYVNSSTAKHDMLEAYNLLK